MNSSKTFCVLNLALSASLSLASGSLPAQDPENGCVYVEETSQPRLGRTWTVPAGSDGNGIQALIQQAGSGDTVVFPAGTYTVESPIILKAGVLYQGESGAVLVSPNCTGIFTNTKTAGNGITIDHLTFDGGNVHINGSLTQPVQGFTLTNCTIKNITKVTRNGWGDQEGVFLNCVNHATIRNNTFSNNTLNNSIIGYDLNSATITQNTFLNDHQGIHLESHTGNGNQIVISNNTGSGFQRMAIEVQRVAQGLQVVGNTFTQWRPGGDTTAGLSIVPSGSGNVITHNTLDGALGGSGHAYVGIEVNGPSGLVANNTVRNFTTAILVSCTPGTVYQDNVITYAAQYGAFGKDGGYCGGEKILQNTINGKVLTGWVH